MKGELAAVLLFGGRLQALRTASLSRAFPFAIVILVLGVSLLLGFRAEINDSSEVGRGETVNTRKGS